MVALFDETAGLTHLCVFILGKKSETKLIHNTVMYTIPRPNTISKLNKK